MRWRNPQNVTISQFKNEDTALSLTDKKNQKVQTNPVSAIMKKSLITCLGTENINRFPNSRKSSAGIISFSPRPNTLNQSPLHPKSGRRVLKGIEVIFQGSNRTNPEKR